MMIFLCVVIAVISFLGLAIYGFKKYIELKKYSKNFKMIKGICTDDNRFYDSGVGVLDESRGIQSLPYVVYKVENREYGIFSKIAYGGIAAFIVKGRKFKVLYNPNDPYDAVLKNSLNFYFLFFLVSVIFIVAILYLFTPVIYDSISEDFLHYL